MFENLDLFSKKRLCNKGFWKSLVICVGITQAFFVNDILEYTAHFSASFDANLETVKRL